MQPELCMGRGDHSLVAKGHAGTSPCRLVAGLHRQPLCLSDRNTQVISCTVAAFHGEMSSWHSTAQASSSAPFVSYAIVIVTSVTYQVRISFWKSEWHGYILGL